MAFFTLYFDDSGTHLQAPVAIGAVWIAPVLVWKNFEKEWESVKSKFGFKCFHASECIYANLESNSKSEFATWDSEKRYRLIRRLLQLSMKYGSRAFAIAVNKQDYDELVSQQMKEKMGRHHYTWAVKSALGFVEQWRSGRNNEESEYIFDTMTETKGDREKKQEIEEIFETESKSEHGLKRYGIHPGCLSFRDRCDVTPLQASDLLAWCVYQRTHHVITGKEPHELAIEVFNTLHKGKILEAYICTRHNLIKFLNQYKGYEGEPPYPIIARA